MSSCQLCARQEIRQIEAEVIAGRITIAEAASQANVPYQTMWHHINNHVMKKPARAVSSELSDMLEDILKKLQARVNVLLQRPVSGAESLTKQIDTLRRLAVDIARLRQELQEAPLIQFQQIIASQTKLQTFLMEELCSACRGKLLKHLESVTNV